MLRGSVTAEKNVIFERLDAIIFQVGLSSGSGQTVDFSSSALVITYIDDNQTVNFPGTAWSATWLSGGSGPLLDPDERVEFNINLVGQLSPVLATSTEFTIQVKPNVGATININRTTPPVLTKAVNLQ